MYLIKIKKPTEQSFSPLSTCIEDSLRIESILGQTIDTCTFQLVDEANNINIDCMSEIQVLDPTNKKIFAGLVTMVSESYDGTHRILTLNCQDYTALLTSSYLYASFIPDFHYAGYAGDKARIVYAFENCSYGSLVTAEGATPEINARTYVDPQGHSPLAGGMSAETFNTVTLADFMNTMCSYNSFNYYIDFDKYLHYYEKTDYESAYILDNRALMNTDPLVNNLIDYRGFTLKRDATNVKNQYILVSNSVRSDNQTLIYDTISNTNAIYYQDDDFTLVKLGLDQALKNVTMLAPAGSKHINIWLGNTAGTATQLDDDSQIGVDGVDKLDGTIIALHASDQQTLKLAGNQIGKYLKIVYTYANTYGVYNMDDNSIAKYGRVFCSVVGAHDSNSIVGLQKKVSNYLNQFAFELKTITLTIDTTSVGVDTLETGQWIKVRYSQNGSNYLLDEYFVIYRISTLILGGDTAEMELELRNWYTENQ